MKIAIVGSGKVGGYLISQLSDEGHEITVIEKNQDVLDHILSENDINGVCGDGANHDVLIEAGAGNCDFLIAATIDDNTNLIAAIMAKKMGAKYTVARVRDPQYMNDVKFMRESMGVDMLINPEYEAAKEIQRTLKYSNATSVEPLLNGKVNMIQINVPDNSKIANRTLNEISNENDVRRILITLVSRGDELYIPNGSFVIRSGDTIHVAGTAEDLGIFYRYIFNYDRELNKILILGAGRICYYLSDLLLKRGFSVKVIEKDRQKAIAFVEKFPKVDVILADGTDPEILNEERAQNYDALVSLTGIDEENILMALLGEKLEIPKLIAKVDRLSLLRITGILDIDNTITPKRSIANIILRVVRSKANVRGSLIKSLYRLEDDRAEALEFDVDNESKIINIPLKDLKLKPEVLIAYILSKGKITVPKGDDVIKPGNRVVIISKNMKFSEIDDALED